MSGTSRLWFPGADAGGRTRVTSDDTTPDYLNEKITVSDGTNFSGIIGKNVNNPGANETVNLQIDETKIDHTAVQNIGTNSHAQIDTHIANLLIHAQQSNIVRVAKSGGDFNNVKDAIGSIIDATLSKPYTVLIFPGVYLEDNPIQCKEWVSVIGMGGSFVTNLLAQNPNQNMFNMTGFLLIRDVNISGISGSGYSFSMTTSGIVAIVDCIENENANGIFCNNANASLTIVNHALFNTVVTTVNAVCVLAGNVYVNGYIIAGESTVTTGVEANGNNAIITVSELLSFSPNLTTGFRFTNGCQVSGNSDYLIGCYDGIVVDGNNTNVRLDVIRISNVQNDGFRIDNVGTGINVSLFTTTITESSNLNFNILNINSTTTGNGFTELDKSFIVPGAGFYASILDTKESDEAVNILGELHVGRPQSGAESVLGEGDSYTNGMLVYTETSGSVFADVSINAASPSGSTFTFPSTGVNNAIYISSSLISGDYLIHHGIKMIIDNAAVLGAGNIVAEYYNGATWEEINAMVTDSDVPFLPYAKDYFNRTGGFQIRYDIVRMNDGTWTKNNPMGLSISYFWIRFRITSTITTAPIFQQWKLHSSRSEINSDGFIEFFGNGRPYAQLPISVGSGKPFEGNMQSQTIYMDENIGVGYLNNRFTATGDKFGWEIIAPNRIDTSSQLAFRFCGRPSSTASMTWTIRWTWQNPDGTIYTSEPAGGSNLNSKSGTIIKSVISGTVEWFELFLDISDLIARRDTDFPDIFYVSIQPSVLSGTFDLMGVQAYYLIWCTGGHAD